MSIIKNITLLDLSTQKLRNGAINEITKAISENNYSPILFRTNFYSFFDLILDDVKKGEKSKIIGEVKKFDFRIKEKINLVKLNIESTKKRKEREINFLINSSIWIRFCDNGNWDGNEKNTNNQTKSIIWALKEFKWFQNLGLYYFKPAQEYIEYQIRVQKENFLAEIGSAHGEHVTPMLYSNEVVFRDFFFKNDKKSLGVHFLPNPSVQTQSETPATASQQSTVISEQTTVSDKQGSVVTEPSAIFSEQSAGASGLIAAAPKPGDSENNDFKTKDVGLRILMLDDKIGKPENEKKIQSCSGGCFAPQKSKDANDKPLECGKNCNFCKLRIVRELLSGGFIDKDSSDFSAFQERTYWTEEVDAFSVDNLKISDVWEIESNGKLKRKTKGIVEVLNNTLNNQNHIQIIGVRDLESAISLMSCCKFDIILLDYLLGERSKGDPERTYSTELFDFLNYEFNGNRKTEAEQTEEESEQKPPILELLGQSFNQEQIQQLQGIIRSKRGPIGKFWFIPMTSYNASFITDLQKNNIRLIDYRWNISQGADPINTPWKFLNKITNFIDLQLQLCVYTMEDLLRFIKGTCEGAEELDKGHEKDSGKKLDFYEFQSYMGAEYVSFMRRYGNRHLILRDAVCDKNSSDKEANIDKSVFATYVWDKFYNEPKFRDVIELNRLLQRFLQHVSSMHNDQFGRQRMIEAFGQLCFFIETNKKVQDCIKEHPELIESADSDKNPSFSDYLEKLHQRMETVTNNEESRKKNK